MRRKLLKYPVRVSASELWALAGRDHWQPAEWFARIGTILVLELAQRVQQPAGTIDIGKVTVEKDQLTMLIGADGVPRRTGASFFVLPPLRAAVAQGRFRPAN